MFGLGITEILIFLVVLTMSVAVPLGITLLLIAFLRKGNNSVTHDSYVQLRDENERLRNELAALQNPIKR